MAHKVLFSEKISPEQARKVSSGIGKGIKEGKDKLRLAIAAMDKLERAIYERLTEQLTVAQRNVDDLLREVFLREGLELPKRLQRKGIDRITN